MRSLYGLFGTGLLIIGIMATEGFLLGVYQKRDPLIVTQTVVEIKHESSCNSDDAMKWWTGSNNLNNVRQTLCSSRGKK